MKSFRLILLFIYLSASTLCAQIKFQKHGIATISTPFDVEVADLNQDGYMDILTADNGNGGEIRWFRNNGDQTFSGAALATGITNPRSVRVGDIDQDGDPDLIAALINNNQICWWENKGEMQFSKIIIDETLSGPHTVELYDLDQDGDTDILGCEFDHTEEMSEVAWWENDGSQNWSKHTVSSRFQQATFILGGDLDQDGDRDLIACGELNGEVVWWKNDGHFNWEEIMIDNHFPKAHTLQLRDFDKDGDPDVLAHACSSGLQAWYENQGNGTFIKHEMEQLGGAIWLDQGDFDRDGDNDLIGTGMGVSRLVCYENDGDQRLTKMLVDGAITSGFALRVVDLDGDEDQDVVAIGYGSNAVAWWENITPDPVVMGSASRMYWDQESGMTYMSNEEGSIGVIPETGRPYVLNNGFPVCSGITQMNDLIWINSGVELIGVDMIQGIKKVSYRIPAQYLCGLAKSTDGILFLSDPYAGNIHIVNPVSGENRILTSELSYPQQVYFDELSGKLIVLDGEELITLQVIDPETGQIEKTVETDIVSGGELVGDGRGNYYICSPAQGVIYCCTRNLAGDIIEFSSEALEPLSLGYDPDKNDILVFDASSLEIMRLQATATGVNPMRPGEADFYCYPNPARDHVYMTNPGWESSRVALSICTSAGQMVYQSELVPQSALQDTKVMFPAHLPSGSYFLIVNDAKKYYVQPLIIN